MNEQLELERFEGEGGASAPSADEHATIAGDESAYQRTEHPVVAEPRREEA